jgi:hypothetical protein
MHKSTVIVLIVLIAAAIVAARSAHTSAVTGAEYQAPKNPPPVLPEKPAVEMNKKSLERLHKDRVDVFVAEDGFGMRRIVTMPKARAIVLPTDSTGQKYRIESMDLIGLIPDSQPAVYLASANRHRPRPKDVKKRALDEFETEAVANFDKRELMWKMSDKNVRMVGVLRATQDCMSCHKTKEGEILGAFTYVLVPGELTPEQDALDKYVNQLELQLLQEAAPVKLTRPTPE